MSGFTPRQAEAAQGPEWLVSFVMNPPLWFKLALFAAATLVVGLAVRSVIKRGLHISADEQRSVALILGTVEGVAGGVLASRAVLGLGFAGDVAIGLVVGFIGVEVLARACRRVGPRVADEATRLLGVWLVLAAGGVALPPLAQASGSTPPPGLDIAVLTVAGGMAIWTLLQEFGEGGVREALEEV